MQHYQIILNYYEHGAVHTLAVRSHKGRSGVSKEEPQGWEDLGPRSGGEEPRGCRRRRRPSPASPKGELQGREHRAIAVVVVVVDARRLRP